MYLRSIHVPQPRSLLTLFSLIPFDCSYFHPDCLLTASFFSGSGPLAFWLAHRQRSLLLHHHHFPSSSVTPQPPRQDFFYISMGACMKGVHWAIVLILLWNDSALDQIACMNVTNTASENKSNALRSRVLRISCNLALLTSGLLRILICK